MAHDSMLFPSTVRRLGRLVEARTQARRLLLGCPCAHLELRACSDSGPRFSGLLLRMRPILIVNQVACLEACLDFGEMLSFLQSSLGATSCVALMMKAINKKQRTCTT